MSMSGEKHVAGVGALFNPSMSEFVERSLDQLDYLAIIPDRGWIDNGVGSSPRFQTVPEMASVLSRVIGRRPAVLHGIGLSICSADIFDEEYARHFVAWADHLDSPWISDHLSFSRVGTGHEVNAGVMAPVPYDQEVLDLLVPRVRLVTEWLGRPFLLENNVYYFRYPGQAFTEEQFLNQLCDQSGCGVLLDLHNLYTNAMNHGFSASEYLANLNLDHVIEIHIAGGVPMMGFHTDSHTGPVLEAVWRLLEETVPQARNLRGVTFEFHESSYLLLGESGILEQIDHARAIVSAHKEGIADVAASVPAGGR
jgi:uncharacterized protein (UPF0276 family)